VDGIREVRSQRIPFRQMIPCGLVQAVLSSCWSNEFVMSQKSYVAMRCIFGISYQKRCVTNKIAFDSPRQ